EHQEAVVEMRTVSILLVGEGMIAVPALEAGRARLLARLHPAEERLIGAIEADQHVLQDMRVDGSIVWERGAQVLQLGFLLEAGRRFTLATLPPRLALLQGGIVERATAPEHLLQRPLLCGRRFQLLLKGLARACLSHG